VDTLFPPFFITVFATGKSVEKRPSPQLPPTPPTSNLLTSLDRHRPKPPSRLSPPSPSPRPSLPLLSPRPQSRPRRYKIPSIHHPAACGDIAQLVAVDVTGVFFGPHCPLVDTLFHPFSSFFITVFATGKSVEKRPSPSSPPLNPQRHLIGPTPTHDPSAPCRLSPPSPFTSPPLPFPFHPRPHSRPRAPRYPLHTREPTRAS
jgi:hypothetical protein